MKSEDIKFLKGLTSNTVSVYNRIHEIVEPGKYICIKDCIVNYIGRTVPIGEIIDANLYDRVQDFNKKNFRKLSLIELIEIAKSGNP